MNRPEPRDPDRQERSVFGAPTRGADFREALLRFVEPTLTGAVEGLLLALAAVDFGAVFGPVRGRLAFGFGRSGMAFFAAPTGSGSGKRPVSGASRRPLA
jgi:hypothetical protein